MIDMNPHNISDKNPFAEGDQARSDLEWAFQEIAKLKIQITLLMQGQITLLKDYNDRVHDNGAVLEAAINASYKAPQETGAEPGRRIISGAASRTSDIF